jgi:cytidylate kinase
MIITISGKAGSGKSTAAKLLAKRLGFEHYSVGDMRKRMALKRGMTLAELNRLGEKEDFTDREVDEYQGELGRREDNFVIDSRLGSYFIPNAVKIFITADVKERAKRVYKDERKVEHFHDLEETEKALEARDKSDRFRYKKYYNIDFKGGGFDLVIDSSNKKPGIIVDEIMGFLREKGLLKQL